MAGASRPLNIFNLILAVGSGVILIGLSLVFSNQLNFESLNILGGLVAIALGFFFDFILKKVGDYFTS